MTSYGAVASRGDAANDPRRREAAYGWTLGGLLLWVSDDPASETDVSFNDLRAQINFGSNWKARLDDLMAKLAAEGALP